MALIALVISVLVLLAALAFRSKISQPNAIENLRSSYWLLLVFIAPLLLTARATAEVLLDFHPGLLTLAVLGWILTLWGSWKVFVLIRESKKKAP